MKQREVYASGMLRANFSSESFPEHLSERDKVAIRSDSNASVAALHAFESFPFKMLGDRYFSASFLDFQQHLLLGTSMAMGEVGPIEL